MVMRLKTVRLTMVRRFKCLGGLKQVINQSIFVF